MKNNVDILIGVLYHTHWSIVSYSFGTLIYSGEAGGRKSA